MVGPETSCETAAKAFSTIFLLYAFSRSIGRSGFPVGDVKLPPNIILFDPTFFAIDVKPVICAVGIPTLSNSFVIVAPQRVQVPQVVVISAALTPAFKSSSAMLLPIFLLLSIFVPTPQVVKKYL